MNTYVALLRAVNVGGNNKVPMRELKALFATLGHDAVVTYIQSGNIVFRNASDDEPAICAGIEAGIARTFGVTSPVVLRTRAELAAVATANPFLAEGADPARLLVMFLGAAPSAAAIATLDPRRSPPDAFAVRGREIYLSCPNGAGNSKLTIDYFERRLGTRATARNWNTVTTLLGLAGG